MESFTAKEDVSKLAKLAEQFNDVWEVFNLGHAWELWPMPSYSARPVPYSGT